MKRVRRKVITSQTGPLPNEYALHSQKRIDSPQNENETSTDSNSSFESTEFNHSRTSSTLTAITTCSTFVGETCEGDYSFEEADCDDDDMELHSTSSNNSFLKPSSAMHTRNSMNSLHDLIGDSMFEITRLGEEVKPSDKDYELMVAIQRGISRLFRMDQTFPDPPRTKNFQSSDQSIDALVEDDFLCDNLLHFRDNNVEFRNYCPVVFQKIRNKFGISERVFGGQLGGIAGPFTRLGTPGKSGAFFFFCPSMQYLLKTVTDEEHAFFMDLLPNYTKYVVKNPTTLLSNFYAFFEVTLNLKEVIGREKREKFRFVVMNNVFFTNLTLSRRYDLKGSTAGRAATDVEKKKKSPILKDLDISAGAIKLTHESKLVFYDRLQADCKFLADNDVMDYSLLLGVHTVDPNNVEYQDLYGNIIHKHQKRWCGEFHNCIASRDGDEIYFFGIIDILQRFNGRKLMEKMVKSGMQKMKERFNAKKEKISVAQPRKYARRFEQFMKILCSRVTLSQFKVGGQKSFQNIDETQEFYHMTIRNNTHDWQALFFRAVMYHVKMGDVWNAMEDLNKSIKVNPTYKNVKSYLWRAMLHVELGDPEAAIKDLTKLIEMNPYCADACLLRGCVYHACQKQYSLAEKDYCKALEINPSLVDPYHFSKIMRVVGLRPTNPHIQRGILFAEMLQADKAVQELNKSIDVMPKSAPVAYHEIARLYEQLKDHTQAITYYSLSIKSDKKFYESYVARGLLIKSADVETALKDFSRAIEINPKYSPAFMARGTLYANNPQQLRLALDDFNSLVQIDPLHIRAYLQRAFVHEQLQNYLLAEIDYLTAIELDTNHVNTEAIDRLMELYEGPLKDPERLHFWSEKKTKWKKQ